MPWLVPALLHRRGLVPALAAQLNRTHPQARLDIDDTGRPWLARAVEAAGDLFCLEVAPTDLPSRIQLRVETRTNWLSRSAATRLGRRIRPIRGK